MCTLPANAVSSNYKEQKVKDINDMLNKIRHLNIVRGIRVQPDTFLHELARFNLSGIPILITPHLNGGSLRHQLNDIRNACGMCETDVRHILMALKHAIFYLHSLSIVHRDLKPESVVIELTADGQRIYKLTDAGNSKPLEISQRIEISRNVAYTAPELIIDTTEKYGAAIDYWSLGIIAYEIAAGERPFVPHLPLAQWVLRVRDKKSDHICIYETNDGEIIYSNHIWPANQLTSEFANGLEGWLQLAFEWNPKQRGCIFEKRPNGQLETSQANENRAPSSRPPPVQVLKFFDTIDDALSQKLLTIFTLSNHKWFSMQVTERTTMHELHTFIEQKSQIPAETCYIIQNDQSTCTDHGKPIDFYRDYCSDEPMIFAMQIEPSTITNGNRSNVDNNNIVFPTDTPATVESVLKCPEKPLKSHSLRRFACDALHFVRMENRKFKISLNGWFIFAEQLNRDIEQCHLGVRRMLASIYGLSGALDLFKMTVQLVAAEQLAAYDFSSVQKIAQNLERLKNACDKIALRHSSLSRRCREICQHELLIKRNVQDFYDVVNTTRAYATLHDQIAHNRMPSKPHFELFQCIYKCLKQRDTLLRSNAFCELKRNLMCIHTELVEIRKALEKAVTPTERYRCDLWEANKKLHEIGWSVKEHDAAAAEATRDEKMMTATADIATSTADLIHLATNGTNPNDTSVLNDQDQQVNSFELIDNFQSLNDSNRHVTQTKLIIEDNINLRISMADVMNEINDELRRCSI